MNDVERRLLKQAGIADINPEAMALAGMGASAVLGPALFTRAYKGHAGMGAMTGLGGVLGAAGGGLAGHLAGVNREATPLAALLGFGGGSYLGYKVWQKLREKKVRSQIESGEPVKVMPEHSTIGSRWKKRPFSGTLGVLGTGLGPMVGLGLGGQDPAYDIIRELKAKKPKVESVYE